MNEQEAREYSESLGQIFDGGYRQAAWADKQQIPKALGLNTRDWVMQYLGGYVRMSVEQRKEAVLELAQEGISNAGIARALGVSDKTVTAVRAGEEPQDYRKRKAAEQENVVADDVSASSTVVADDVPASAWGQILRDASKAAREDPLANVYGLLKSAALIKSHLDPDMFADADEDERLRVFNDLEEAMATVRRVQKYATGDVTVRASA